MEEGGGPEDSLIQAQPDWSPSYGSTTEDDDETHLPEDCSRIPETNLYSGTTINLTQPTSNIEEMSVSQLGSFLCAKGIPKEYSEVFEKNYIDGTEFFNLTEVEVKAMIPPIGLHRKIMRILEDQSQKRSSCFCLDTSTSSRIFSPTISSSSPAPSSISTPNSSASSKTEIMIPEHWRPEVELCIEEKVLTERARNEIIRTLVNLLFTRSRKPSRYECDSLARKLILVYPFIKDDLGNGYQSWSDKMVERIRNVIKRDCKGAKQTDESEVPSSKRRKKEVELLRRYPVTSNIDSGTVENADSIREHKKAIDKELSKKNTKGCYTTPSYEIDIYNERRIHVLNVTSSVSDFLQKYPAMSRPAVVEQEMGLIFERPSFKSHFLTQWSKYVEAILLYAEKSSKKGVSSKLVDLDRDDETSKHLTSLKVLCECLGKGKQSLCYVYEEYEAMDIEIVCSKPLTQPRIAALIGEEETQYLIIL